MRRAGLEARHEHGSDSLRERVTPRESFCSLHVAQNTFKTHLRQRETPTHAADGDGTCLT